MAANPYVTRSAYSGVSGVATDNSSDKTTSKDSTENFLVNTNYGFRPNIQQAPTTAPSKNKSNAYPNQYKQDAIMSMTQGELLLKLYDEIIKQLNIAISAIDDQDDATKSQLAQIQEDFDSELVKENTRKLARELLEAKIKKRFEDECKEFTENDIKNAVTEQDITNLVKEIGVKNNNNGGKAKSSKNNVLASKRDKAILKTRKIIDHLRMTLDFSVDEGIAEDKNKIAMNLNSLYVFFRDCVNDANTNNVSKPLKDILPLVQDLRDAYAEAEKNVRSGK